MEKYKIVFSPTFERVVEAKSELEALAILHKEVLEDLKITLDFEEIQTVKVQPSTAHRRRGQ